MKSGKNAKVGYVSFPLPLIYVSFVWLLESKMMLTLSRPYCQAFTDKKPGNVCSAKTKVIGDWGFDVAEYAYVYNHSTKKFDYVGK